MDPAPRWLKRPNREQLWPEFCAQMVDSLLGEGNLFVDVRNKGRDGLPSDLFVLNPAGVVVGRRKDTNTLLYTDRSGRPFADGDLIHVRALTLPGQDRGLSPIEMARQEIGLGRAAQKYMAKFYVNGATVSAVLEFPPDMTKAQVEESAATFRGLYTGSADKAHAVAAVAGGEYKPMGITAQQAQFLEQRQFTVVDIGTRIYGIPPHRLGALLDKPQFGNSIEQMNMSFVQDAIVPWTTLLEAAFTYFVLPAPAYLHFNLNGLLRGDAQSRAAFYQTMRQQLGVFNGDDVLALEDMNPMPDEKGQAYWMPANTYLVGSGGFPILPERQGSPDDSTQDGESA
jgi:HK97 family phage portal protein